MSFVQNLVRFLTYDNFDCPYIGILLIRDMVVESCNRRFGRETIHPTKKYFNEFIANVLRDNIGILIFDLHGGC